jgi:predicted DNA-binding antitoxin AbrB/MazE fold protein
MPQRLQAVYEGGVLRPIEPLRLAENQLVSVILFDDPTSDDILEFEDPAHFEALADNTVTREAVRAALSKIPGSLDADFSAERHER